MSRRRRAALLAVLACGACRGEADSKVRVEALRREYQQLRQRLEARLARDPVVDEAPAAGPITVALHRDLVQGVFREVARRYLDRVELDLDRDIHVRTAGEIKTRTFLGTLKGGDWTVDIAIHRIQGVFRARSPRVELLEGNRVRLGLGVVLEGARGTATLRFAWDATRVASLVCGDFEVERRLSGVVLPETYPVVGGFRIGAGPESILARPEFGTRTFRLRVDLVPESWGEVQRALEAQDTLGRCGLALDPEAVLARLRELVHEGFDLRLPQSLFRTLRLPASLTPSVAVGPRRVTLDVQPGDLHVGRTAIWYSASVRSRVDERDGAGRP